MIAETYAANAWQLRVTDLKQYEYCPRVVYYAYCLPGIRPTTYKMNAGIAAQEKVTDLEERRGLRTYGVSSGERRFYVHVQSQRLGCTGQIDMVIDSDDGGRRRLIPVDFKLSRKEPGRHFRLQLACYGMMLEEMWQIPAPVGYIYLIPSRSAVQVELTTRLRGDAERALAAIRREILAERMPEPTPRRSRCVDCEFRRFCNDVV
jgi:CRISPR-associated exonuclease Cas4